MLVILQLIDSKGKILIHPFFWSSTFFQLFYFPTGYSLQQTVKLQYTQNRLFN